MHLNNNGLQRNFQTNIRGVFPAYVPIFTSFGPAVYEELIADEKKIKKKEWKSLANTIVFLAMLAESLKIKFRPPPIREVTHSIIKSFFFVHSKHF